MSRLSSISRVRSEWMIRAACLIFCFALAGCDGTTFQPWASSREKQWRFRSGDRFVVDSDRTVYESFCLPAQALKGVKPSLRVTNSRLKESWTVASVSDSGTAEMRRQFDEVHVTVSDPDIVIASFDSLDPDTDTGGVTFYGASKLDFRFDGDVYRRLAAQNCRNVRQELRDALSPVVGSQEIIHLSKRGELLDSQIPPTVTENVASRLRVFLRDYANLKVLSLQMTAGPFSDPTVLGSTLFDVDPVIGETQFTFTREGTIERNGKQFLRLTVNGHLDAIDESQTRASARPKRFWFTGETLFDETAGNVAECRWQSEVVTAGVSKGGEPGETRVVTTQTVTFRRL